jgi:hypothetical protein
MKDNQPKQPESLTSHNKVHGVVPKTARGKAAVEKLGRNVKTGGFAKIVNQAAKEYGSKEAGEKVAGAIYQKMVRKQQGM